MPKDKYASFRGLQAGEENGEDYAIDCRRVVDSRVVIIAPHGGHIEPFTDTIADEIAGHDFSFYAFRGLKPGSPLHITSNLFDEPLCLDLMAAHERALSIHGWGAAGERACIGGRDGQLMAELQANLKAAGINVADAPGGLRGTDPQNIVNRCISARGVQLELTMALRRNRKAMDDLARAVRFTLKQIP